jgi:hypothetical protein
MSWTYTGNPLNSQKDAVRFLVADTKVEDSFVTDEEILWALQQSNNDTYLAVVVVARALSAQFSVLADEEIGPLKFKYAERAKNYAKIAAQYDNDNSKNVALSGMYSGGIDVADKEANRLDTSLVKPSFARNMMDFRGTSSLSLFPPELTE